MSQPVPLVPHRFGPGLFSGIMVADLPKNNKIYLSLNQNDDIMSYTKLILGIMLTEMPTIDLGSLAIWPPGGSCATPI